MRVSDEEGAVMFGRAHAGVFYARFERSISAEVAVRFCRSFATPIGDHSSVQYFGASSAVTSYDIQAMAVVAEAMSSERHRFERMVIRPWPGAMRPPAGRFRRHVWMPGVCDDGARVRGSPSRCHAGGRDRAVYDPG